MKVSTFISAFLFISVIIGSIIISGHIMGLMHKSPEEMFKNDPSIIEYCYIIDDTKDMPVSNGRETRLKSVTLMYKVCVDRNLSVVSSATFDNSHNEAFMYWHKSKEV